MSEGSARLFISGIGAELGGTEGARAFASALFETRPCLLGGDESVDRIGSVGALVEACRDDGRVQGGRVLTIALGAEALAASERDQLVARAGLVEVRATGAESLAAALAAAECALAAAQEGERVDAVIVHGFEPGRPSDAPPWSMIFDASWRAYPRLPGGAAVLLRRVPRGATIDGAYAEIAAVAVDELEVPGARSLEAAVARALSIAGLEPRDISLVEASGTPRTLIGESVGLPRALRGRAPAACALGSVRATMGDGGAAEVAALVRVAIALRERFIPGVPGWTRPGPRALEEATCFYVPVESRPWLRERGRASLVTLGLPGGRFGAVVLVEAPAPDGARCAPRPSLASRRATLVPIAGQGESGLLQDLAVLRGELRDGGDRARISSARLLRLEQAPPGSLVYALVARDEAELERELDRAALGVRRACADGRTWRTPSGSVFAPAPLGADAKIAFVYPGMGSAVPGFGASLFQQLPRALERLESLSGLDLRTVLGADALYPRTLRRLSEDERRALSARLVRDAPTVSSSSMAISYALTAVAREELGLSPSLAFGYSIGECSMFVALGAWPSPSELARRLAASPTFEDRLGGRMAAVAERWGLTGDAEVPWSQAIVQTSPEAAAAAVAREPRAYLMTINAPDEVMIGGETGACARVVASLGAPSLHVPLRLAIHCDPSRSERGQLAWIHTQGLGPPSDVRFHSASSLTPVPHDAAAIAEHIARAYTEVVDFPALVRRVHAGGARIFVETGARANCSGWIDRILGDAPHATVPLSPEGVDEQVALVRAAAILATHRVPFTATAFLASAPGPGGGVSSVASPPASLGLLAYSVRPAPLAPRAAELSTLLRREAARLLAVDDAGAVPLDEPLELDSLSILRVRAAVERAFGADLPSELFWRHRTIRALAEALAACSPGSPVPREVDVTPAPRSPWSRYEASWIQRGMWTMLGSLRDPRAFHASRSALWVRSRIPVHGALAPDLLTRAIADTFARHDILRSVVEERAGTLWVETLPSWAPPTERIDLVGASDARVDECVEEFFARPIDPSGGPPARVALFARGADDHLLCMHQHHLFTDGSSAVSFWNEVLQRYRAGTEGRSMPASEPPLRYVDYCEAVARWLASPRGASSVEFWRRELDGGRPMRLPFDAPRTTAQDFRGGRLYFTIPRETAERLEALAAREATGLFSVLLAALTACLGRATGDEDLLLVTFPAGRIVPDFADAFELIGPMAGPLLLRCRAGDEPPGARVRAAHRVFTTALDHGAVPVEFLRERLGLPVYRPQVSLVYQSFVPPPVLEVGSLVIRSGEPVGFGPGNASFEMELVVWPSERGLDGLVTFATQVFSESTVARLLDAFLAELRALAAAAPP